ncbi:MAG: SUMF1/EgtB/PvdO family nonheme iron enzyme [Acidobacteria bacterium]|nr:SUMF1/EgtB/PvdO family nonheme iron enzyme [Acidobacteriota bacterium]
MEHRERHRILERFDEGRQFSEKLFESVISDAWYDRPIALRQPIVFYEGHLPAFNYNTLMKKALGRGPLDEDLDDLFERGIDPETEEEALEADANWPRLESVKDYSNRADAAVRHALAEEAFCEPDNPLLARCEAIYTILEHELMHHETLKYMLHQLPWDRKKPSEGKVVLEGPEIHHEMVTIPAGHATLGRDREGGFGWDNEFELHRVDVPAFRIDRYNVTNRDFLEFMEAGGYENRDLWSDEGWDWVSRENIAHPHFWIPSDGGWSWRGMHEAYPLPESWPVFVTHAEAEAYAKWKECRLPTEAEFHRAAYGTPDGEEREHPWGNQEPEHRHGNFDHQSTEPMPAGSFPEGASAWGIHDLVGNGWEWTSSKFEPFPGFREMPSYPPYSSDFFDDKHYVIKGASQATSKRLIRRSFRNWFRATYPYMYASFRVAK